MTLSIIPLPQKAILTGGAFHVGPDTQITAHPDALPEAQFLAGALRRPVEPNASSGAEQSRSASVIDLRIDPADQNLGAEGYRLTVEQSGITLRAAARAGLFYGIQTLLQLMPPSVYGLDAGDAAAGEITCDIPCVEIEDAPRFRWRGAMLDVSRHFLPCEFVLKFIDLLALHKMNVLHLHLTDDQGWRIEIKKYPRLTSVGALRAETLVGTALTDPASDDFSPESQRFDGIPYGGFYTQDQAKEIVAYAAARYITVVPEIEMPGHAQAAIAAYPFLGSLGEDGGGDGPTEVSPRWGIHEALYKPDERTFEFLQDVLTEVMQIFPSPFIHVGGDEAVKTQWQSSPECQAILRELGLRDEAEMQSYFIKRIDRWLSSQGRALIGWDEILEGGLAPGAVVMSWRGEQGGIDAARAGHDVVMAPYQTTYFDYYQSEEREREPLAFPAYLPLATVYGYEPVPAELPEEFAGHVLGAQCQLWSEYMPTSEQVEYQAFPRLSALAEVTWTQPDKKQYADFLSRLKSHLARLDAMSVHYRPV